MPSHRFDPVALVCGGVFVAVGVIVLTGGELIEEGRALVPAGLIALGVALLVHVGRRARPPAVAGQTEPAPPVASDADLDRLFAPVDEVLARLDAERASAGESETDATVVDPPRSDATDDARTEADGVEPDPTEVDPGEADDTEVDPTEVVEPTERYERPDQ
ncbi:MAG TPA: hypothetical protein VE623_05705 [Acidimicrobiales bacterium]|nr:hypothetical protein [Acidimicrobiales bacterium]